MTLAGRPMVSQMEGDKMDIVKVTCLDATSPCPGMAPLEEMKTVEPVPVESVGYLLVSDDTKVSLVMSQSEGDHGCDLLVVPKGMVVKMERLVTYSAYDINGQVVTFPDSRVVNLHDDICKLKHCSCRRSTDHSKCNIVGC